MSTNEFATAGNQRQGGLLLPWGWLSLVLGIIALASLGTLAVVADRKDADTLSTVALALAVLAFTAQLIVSLAQGYSGSQQVAETQRVNLQAQSALTGIRATSDALLANQRDIVGQLLGAALGAATPGPGLDAQVEDPESDLSVDEMTREQELERRLIERLTATLPGLHLTPRPEPTPHPTYALLMGEVEEADRPYIERFQQLSPWEVSAFVRRASSFRNVARIGRSGSYIRRASPHEIAPLTSSLVNKGYYRVREDLANDDRPFETHYFMELTDAGLRVARAVLGTHARRPKWLRDLIQEDLVRHSADGQLD